MNSTNSSKGGGTYNLKRISCKEYYFFFRIFFPGNRIKSDKTHLPRCPASVILDNIHGDVGVPVGDDLLLDALLDLELVSLGLVRLSGQEVGRLSVLLLLVLVQSAGLVERPFLGEPSLPRAGIRALPGTDHKGVKVYRAVVFDILSIRRKVKEKLKPNNFRSNTEAEQLAFF